MMRERFKDELASEAIRLFRRYEAEVVVRFGLCPWAQRARKDGKVREEVIFHDASLASVVRRMTEASGDEDAEIVVMLFPEFGGESSDFRSYFGELREAYLASYERGAAPFVMASFHPHGRKDPTSPDSLVSFLRRSPDPLIQMLSHNKLQTLKDGRPAGTQFLDLASWNPSQEILLSPSLTEQVAQKNHATMRAIGIKKVEKILDEIRQDRDKSYAELRDQFLRRRSR